MKTIIEYPESDDLDELPEIDLADELDADTPELASSGVEDSFEDADPTEQDQPEDQRPKTKADTKAEAKMIVNTFDLLQKNVFQYAVYPSVILKRGDYQKVERSKVDGNYIMDDETTAALDRWAEFEAKCKALSLSKEEKDQIVEPLSKVLQKWNSIQVSPEMTLLFVLGLIMLPRLEPVFPSMFKKLDNLFK